MTAAERAVDLILSGLDRRHGTAYPSYAHIDEATSPRTTQENDQ